MAQKVTCEYCGQLNYSTDLECRKCGGHIPDVNEEEEFSYEYDEEPLTEYWIDGGVPSKYPGPSPYSSWSEWGIEKNGSPSGYPVENVEWGNQDELEFTEKKTVFQEFIDSYWLLIFIILFSTIGLVFVLSGGF